MTLDVDDEIRTKAAPDCYLCGTRGITLYQGLHDRFDTKIPGVWNLKRCPNPECRLVWLNPRPCEEDIGKLYADYYTHVPETAPRKDVHTRSLRESVRKAILASVFGYRGDDGEKWDLPAFGTALGRNRFLQDWAGRSVMWLENSRRGRLLDFGCGSGRFLARMKQMGWQVFGFDADPVTAQVAREHNGLDVYDGSLESAGFADASFDAVTMSHVIEHLPDPVNTLKVCARLLKKGGRLVAVTPNADSLGHRWLKDAWHYLDPPRHLMIFSAASLRTCVEAAGFYDAKIWTSALRAKEKWAKGRVIQRKGMLGSFNPPDLPRRYMIGEGWLFRLIENLLIGHKHCGEEVVLIAEKM